MTRTFNHPSGSANGIANAGGIVASLVSQALIGRAYLTSRRRVALRHSWVDAFPYGNVCAVHRAGAGSRPDPAIPAVRPALCRNLTSKSCMVLRRPPSDH